MTELFTAAAAGDRTAMEVAADYHEQRGLMATALALRLCARGYAVPALQNAMDRLARAGIAGADATNGVLSRRLVKAVVRELRDYDAACFRKALITVHCTGCGKPHSGERRVLAKWRKCCSTKTTLVKHCRGCGSRIERAEYEMESCLTIESNAQGWKTLATCSLCRGPS